jgi:hypothetical protein
VGQAIGAIAIIATLAWTFIKDSDTINQTHDQFKAQTNQFNEQQTQARRQFANQQFIAAASLLKEASVGARVAGLYGMKQVASDQSEYLLPTIQAQAAFIKSAPSQRDTKDNGWTSIGADVQSAILIISELNSSNGITVDLSDTYLVRADFSTERSSNAFAGGSFPRKAVWCQIQWSQPSRHKI